MLDNHKYFKIFDPSENLYCNVAVAVIGAGAVGAAATAYSANKAADAQKQAADTAANTSLGMYNTTRGDLAPFRQMGVDAGSQLMSRLSDLTKPITMDQATLEGTPGYQFNLTQGLKSVQNSAAARGLGSSGAALKGATTFATGLADSTYQNQFANAVTNQTNAFNRLKSLVDTGENASAQTGVIGNSASNTAAQAQIAGGNAQAAGINATGTAINNFANNAGAYAMYKGLYGNSNAADAGLSNGVGSGGYNYIDAAAG